jgi:hypothetical protein
MNLYGRGDNFACDLIERRIDKHVLEVSKDGADRDVRRFSVERCSCVEFMRTCKRRDYEKNETPCVSVTPCLRVKPCPPSPPLPHDSA